MFGTNQGTTGIGVHGRTAGTGSGVFGQATNNGVGVFGTSTNGTGVLADSDTGTALSVTGKASFSRSGITTIAAGSASRTITMAGVTTSCMVMATAQQIQPVFVKAAVPGTGSFTIRLTGNAPLEA